MFSELYAKYTVLLPCNSAGPLKPSRAFGSPTVNAPSASRPRAASDEPSSTIAEESSDVEQAVKEQIATEHSKIDKYFLNIFYSLIYEVILIKVDPKQVRLSHLNLKEGLP